jgi:hypothetical protein
MVTRGFVPQKGKIPSPDMSFVRMLEDTSIGWLQRGQYAMWTGASVQGEPQFRLLERSNNKICVIASDDGGFVMHRIPAKVSFTVENLMGCWFSFDSDAIWIDLPKQQGRYSILAIGGAEGKPSSVEVDCPCPQCGAPLNPSSMTIPPQRFKLVLDFADKWVQQFNSDEKRRACINCDCVHPPTTDRSLSDPTKQVKGS